MHFEQFNTGESPAKDVNVCLIVLVEGPDYICLDVVPEQLFTFYLFTLLVTGCRYIVLGQL